MRPRGHRRSSHRSRFVRERLFPPKLPTTNSIMPNQRCRCHHCPRARYRHSARRRRVQRRIFVRRRNPYRHPFRWLNGNRCIRRFAQASVCFNVVRRCLWNPCRKRQLHQTFQHLVIDNDGMALIRVIDRFTLLDFQLGEEASMSSSRRPRHSMPFVDLWQTEPSRADKPDSHANLRNALAEWFVFAMQD